MTEPRLSDSHLESLRGTAEEVVAGTERLATGLSDSQLVWKPAPERWSIAECFAHLVATGDVYYPRARRAIEETRARGLKRTREFRPSWFGRKFIEAAGPQGKRRLRAFKVFRPAPAPPPGTWRTFVEQQRTLFDLLRDADGLDLTAVKVPSPVSRFLALRLGECLTMLVRHEQRHLLQAERVRQEPAFPRS